MLKIPPHLRQPLHTHAKRHLLLHLEHVQRVIVGLVEIVDVGLEEECAHLAEGERVFLLLCGLERLGLVVGGSGVLLGQDEFYRFEGAGGGGVFC